jgi:hypothetical protein
VQTIKWQGDVPGSHRHLGRLENPQVMESPKRVVYPTFLLKEAMSVPPQREVAWYSSQQQ